MWVARFGGRTLFSYARNHFNSLQLLSHIHTTLVLQSIQILENANLKRLLTIPFMIPMNDWFQSYLLATLLLIYVAANTVGLVTLPALMVGELIPMRARGIGGGCTFGIFNFLIFIITKCFPSVSHRPDSESRLNRVGFSPLVVTDQSFMIEEYLFRSLPAINRNRTWRLETYEVRAIFSFVESLFQVNSMIGVTGIFIIFGIFALLVSVFVYLALPETKNNTLEEIEDYFKVRRFIWIVKRGQVEVIGYSTLYLTVSLQQSNLLWVTRKKNYRKNTITIGWCLNAPYFWARVNKYKIITCVSCNLYDRDIIHLDVQLDIFIWKWYRIE